MHVPVPLGLDWLLIAALQIVGFGTGIPPLDVLAPLPKVVWQPSVPGKLISPWGAVPLIRP